MAEPSLRKTLYARNSNGTVQEWTIEVVGAQYRTISGRHGGQLIQSAWTTAKPKNVGKSNATTPETQALSEAESKIQSKLDEGYAEDVTKIDDMTFIQVMTCTEFNKRVKQTAKAFDLDEWVVVQPKLDGNRAVITPQRIQSRGAKDVVSCPHIREVFEPVFQKYPGLRPDGELYNHLYHDKFDDLQSILRKQKPTEEELKQSREVIQFHWYDIVQLDHDKTSMPYSERQKWIFQIMVEFSDWFAQHQCIQFVPSVRVYSMKEIDEVTGGFLDQGFEGSIIRFDKPYERREKSLVMLKHKPFVDEEYTIVRVEEGDGGREGAAIIVCLTEEGLEFRAACKCPVEKMQAIYGAKEDMIGKQCTVRRLGKPGSKVAAGKRPRHPRVTGIRDVF